MLVRSSPEFVPKKAGESNIVRCFVDEFVRILAFGAASPKSHDFGYEIQINGTGRIRGITWSVFEKASLGEGEAPAEPETTAGRRPPEALKPPADTELKLVSGSAGASPSLLEHALTHRA